MSSDPAPGAPPGERPLAHPGPFLLVTGIGLVAVVALVLSLWRDPGLPAHVAESYMRVAGGLVVPEVAGPDAAGVSHALSAGPPGSVRVPDLSPADFALTGGSRVTLGGAPAAVAIYQDGQRDLLVWHALAGTLDALPPSTDVREAGGRRFVVHYKATLTLVFWQEGPLLAAVTASLPAERVVAAARVAVGGARP
jgi:anti-sigma factor RsiW